MTTRERFLSVLNFEKPNDRYPRIEWAAWWDKTLDRWKTEGMPGHLSWEESLDYFALDKMVCLAARGTSRKCPIPTTHGAPIVLDEKDYDAVLPFLYTDDILEKLIEAASGLKEQHAQGHIIIRLWLDGFFWFPRTLLGIENHLYAFYDYPELMHRINKDLANFNIRAIEALCTVLKPDMVGFAEDMSYNHGPMLSYQQFHEFLIPYYQQVIPHIKNHGIKVLVDSDGDITSMIPWLIEAGIEGVYPLERQAGVDISKIRTAYPNFLMMGGYDKMVMPKGEKEMRAEFERLLPVIRSGGYIPSVDHQTPPGVSLENYRIFIKLFEEYTRL